MSIRGHRRLWAGAIAVVVAAVGFLATYRRVFGPPVMMERTSEWQRRFWATMNEVERAEGSKDWGQAARLYSEAVKLLPDGPDHHYGRARALANLGRGDEAAEALAQAVECGWTDVAGLAAEPAFAAIRGTPAFEELVQRAREVADERIVIYAPPAVEAERIPLDVGARMDSRTSGGEDVRGAALVIAIHGRGQNPHAHIRSWKEAADRLGVVVAAPRGVDRFPGQGRDHSFRWDRADHSSTLPACAELVEESIELAGQRVKTDEKRVVVAGYSQGGAVALALVAEMPERFCGAVVQATSYPPRGVEAWKRPVAARGGRVSLIVHELHRLRPQGEEAYRELKEAGLNMRLDLIAGTDHELPPDNVERRVQAPRFVLGMP